MIENAESHKIEAYLREARRWRAHPDEHVREMWRPTLKVQRPRFKATRLVMALMAHRKPRPVKRPTKTKCEPYRRSRGHLTRKHFRFPARPKAC